MPDWFKLSDGTYLNLDYAATVAANKDGTLVVFWNISDTAGEEIFVVVAEDVKRLRAFLDARADLAWASLPLTRI